MLVLFNFDNLAVRLVEDRSHQGKELRELREVHDLAKRELEAVKAKLHSLAKENKGFKVKVVQLEGEVPLL